MTFLGVVGETVFHDELKVVPLYLKALVSSYFLFRLQQPSEMKLHWDCRANHRNSTISAHLQTWFCYVWNRFQLTKHICSLRSLHVSSKVRYLYLLESLLFRFVQATSGSTTKFMWPEKKGIAFVCLDQIACSAEFWTSRLYLTDFLWLLSRTLLALTAKHLGLSSASCNFLSGCCLIDDLVLNIFLCPSLVILLMENCCLRVD